MSLKISYYIATGLFCLIMIGSALMYIFAHDLAVQAYENLGFPTWMIYPSAVAKLLGVTAILTRRSRMLKEWAYAGFFFDAALALTSHLIAQDGGYILAAIALAAIVVSRGLEEKAFLER